MFDSRRALVTLTTAGAVVLAATTPSYAQGAGAPVLSSQTEPRQDPTGDDNESVDSEAVDNELVDNDSADNDSAAVDDQTAFIRTAVSDSATEIEAARLAQDRAESDEVRDFAERLMDEHQDVMEDAANVAANHGVDAPRMPRDDDETALIDELSNLEGEEFDEVYLRAFVQDQRVAIDDFDAARATMDDDVAEFANRHLDVLRDQLQNAEARANRLDVTIEES